MAPQKPANENWKKSGHLRGSAGQDGLKSAAARPKGGRPSKQAVEELNQRILDIAAGLFASQGFAATSMEQVAASCGAGKDTIYRRYPSKQALFSALMDGLQSRVLAELDQIADVVETPLDTLGRFARALLAINLRPQMVALNRVALGEAVLLGGVPATPAEKDPIMIRFAALVKDAQACGDLSEGDPRFLAEQLLYATSIKPLVSTMLGETRFKDPEEEQRYFDQALSLFLRGAGS